MKALVAVAISDIHLSVDPPRFRAIEEDWLDVQRRYLDTVFQIAENNGRPVPVLIAGDIFNTATPAPEIINSALNIFSNRASPVIAIPGNHDLPHHRYVDMHKSAYGALVEAGRITNVPPGEYIYANTITHRLRIWGFPCGTEVHEKEDIKPIGGPVDLEIALVHAYVWFTGCSYVGAPEEYRTWAYKPKLKGYDVAIFGDNHLGFFQNPSDSCSILNCGTLLIRKTDEKVPNNPAVGLVYSDGSIGRYILDTSLDKYVDINKREKEEPEEMNTEEKEALEAFASLEEQSYNFAEFLRHLVESKKIRVRVKELILESLERK